MMFPMSCNKHCRTLLVIKIGPCHPNVPKWNNNGVLAGLVDTLPCEPRIDFVSPTMAVIVCTFSPPGAAARPRRPCTRTSGLY